jgi:hypothetical protein
MKAPSPFFFMAAISLVSLGVIAMGMKLIDSPDLNRLHKLDERRMSDLHRISIQVEYYNKNHNQLPQSLEQLSLPKKELEDAVTNEPYEYKVHDADSYELCAVFDAPPPPDERDLAIGYGACASPWIRQGSGRYCFTLSPQICQ